jgi:filamentous hemagglutinin family protein
MTQNKKFFFWYLSFLGLSSVISAIALVGENAIAQIQPDNTLAHERSIVKSNVDVGGAPAEIIEGGATREANLFHSFLEFNVKEGQQVYFVNPKGVENILSRVTGNNSSHILGKLGVLGNANLFLINPNGIIFGSKAQLHINGSFVASTVNHWAFPDSSKFSDLNPQAPPLLTINVTIGLQNGTQKSAKINNQGNLTVGKDLTLIGDTVTSTGKLTASAGTVTVQGISEGVEVLDITATETIVFAKGDIIIDSINTKSLDDDGVRINSGGQIIINDTIDASANNPFLNLKAGNVTINAKGDIIIDSINTSSFNDDGGDIRIDSGGQIIINDTIDASAGNPFFNSGGNGGDVTINAKKDIRLTNPFPLDNILSQSDLGLGGEIFLNSEADIFVGGGISNSNASSTLGQGGNVRLVARSLLVNGGLISTQTSGKANSGNVIIHAQENVTFDRGRVETISNNAISFDGNEIAVGDGGNIEIVTGSLKIINSTDTNRAKLSSQTFGRGNAGDIIITATKNILIDGRFSEVLTSVESGSQGNGGKIEITTPELKLTNGAELFASTLGKEDANNIAGDIIIRATKKAELDNQSRLFTSVGTITDEGEAIAGYGQGGDIDITTPELSLTNNAQISASNIAGTGNGGDINLNARSLSLDNEAKIQASTSGIGNAGQIGVRANSVALNNNSQISTSVNKGAIGNGGEINLQARSLSLDNAQISASTAGQGNAGSVKVQNANTVELTNDSQISTSDVNRRENGQGGKVDIQTDSLTLDRGTISATTDSTQGGDIILNVNDLLLLRNGSQITAKAAERGSGGNITINAGTIFAVFQQDNDIIANAFRGDGGDINITTQGLFNLEERTAIPGNRTNDIDASSEFGVDGTVRIDSPNVDPSRRSVPLPNLTITPEVLQGCRAATQQGASRFISTGRGGLPPGIDDLGDRTVWEDLRSPTLSAEQPSESETVESSNSSEPTQIIEAQGWLVGSNGQIVLTAQASTVTPTQIGDASVGCRLSE